MKRKKLLMPFSFSLSFLYFAKNFMLFKLVLFCIKNIFIIIECNLMYTQKIRFIKISSLTHSHLLLNFCFFYISNCHEVVTLMLTHHFWGLKSCLRYMRGPTFSCCAYTVMIPSIIKAYSKITSKKYREAPKEYHMFQFLIFYYGIFYGTHNEHSIVILLSQTLNKKNLIFS